MAVPRFDLCVVGGGLPAVTLAAAAAQLGLAVALAGPSETPKGAARAPAVALQAFLAAARRSADFATLTAAAERAVSDIAVNENPARAAGLGVRLYQGAARFVAADRLAVAGQVLRARRFILIPPARPLAVPGALTAETFWDLRARPERLTVLGGEGFGVSLAPALARLGSQVRLLAPEGLLPREDPEAVELLRRSLLTAGVRLAEGEAARDTAPDGTLLAALGWERDYAGLDLPAAGIACRDGRPLLRRDLRTSNRRVFVLEGEGEPRGATREGIETGFLLKRVLFGLGRRPPALRWVAGEPALVQIGPTETDLAGRRGLRFLRWSLADNERARAEAAGGGLLKVICDRRGRVLGVTLAGTGLEEQSALWSLAVARRLPLAGLAGLPLPHPTRAEAMKRLAGAAVLGGPSLPLLRRLARLLMKLR